MQRTGDIQRRAEGAAVGDYQRPLTEPADYRSRVQGRAGADDNGADGAEKRADNRLVQRCQ